MGEGRWMREESELRFLYLCSADRNKRNGRESFPAVSLWYFFSEFLNSQFLNPGIPKS